MFTGIVQAVGKVAALEPRGGDMRLRIACGDLDLSDLHPGDSVSVSGVCLTVVDLDDGLMSADVSRETLACTTLSRLRPGGRVNLEKALLPTTRLGGHWVSGHVDGVGRVEEIRAAGRSRIVAIAVPASLSRYIAPKGSVCVDGVSLTVNTVSGPVFRVNVIPHTLEATVIGEYRDGREVNIEVDILARYLERLLAPEGREDGEQGIDRAFLAAHGFVSGS